MVNRILLAAAVSVATASIATASLAKAPTAQAQSQRPKAESRALGGQQLFATTCGWCHAGGGRIAGKGPKLAGTTQERQGRRYAGVHGTFSDKKIKAIVAYIHSLKDDGQ